MVFIPARRVVWESFDGEERPAVFLDATPWRCALVGWGFLWRLSASTFLYGSIVFLLVSEGLGIENYIAAVSCYGGVLAMATVAVTGAMFEKRFSGFRLALVKSHPHLG